MITSTRRVSADKPEVQIAFSLDETSGNTSCKDKQIIILGVYMLVTDTVIEGLKQSCVPPLCTVRTMRDFYQNGNKQNPPKASHVGSIRLLPSFTKKQVPPLFQLISGILKTKYPPSHKVNSTVKVFYSYPGKCFDGSCCLGIAASGFCFNTSLLHDSLICFQNTGLNLKAFNTSRFATTLPCVLIFFPKSGTQIESYT